MSHSTSTPVADATHERGEAPVACVDGEPTRGPVAVVAERVGYLRRHSDESAGGDRDRLGFAPDFEGQFALEDVEGVRVLVVNVWAGDLFASRVPRAGDRDGLGRDEDADLAILTPKDLLPVNDWDDHLRCGGEAVAAHDLAERGEVGRPAGGGVEDRPRPRGSSRGRGCRA